MRDYRNQIEGILLLIVVTFALTMCLHCCNRSEHKHIYHEVPKKSVQKIEKLKPICNGDSCKGGYAYVDENKNWWLYSWMYQPSVNNYTSYGSTLPAGGSWTKSELAPEPEAVQELDVPIDVPTNATGPITEERMAQELEHAELDAAQAPLSKVQPDLPPSGAVDPTPAVTSGLSVTK